ncbi:MAG: HAMP domain-containing sensor histidine kinase [Elusimicrobiota bacterium]
MSLKEVKYVKIDEQKGSLYSAGKQSLLIPITFVKALDSTFEKLVGREGAEILIYKIGEALGKGYAQSLRAILEEEGADVGQQALITISCNAIFMEAGWGSVKIRNIDLGENILELAIANSPSSVYLENGSYGLEKGVLVGVFREITSEEVYCRLLEEDIETHTVVLQTVKDIPEEIREKEKIVLISRRELQDKNNELKAAYDELTVMQDQLIQSEKMASIGTIAAGVAHEINNPLGAVLTNTQMLLMKITDDKSVEYLNFIENATRRCKKIVAALLDYTRKSSPANWVELDLSEVIDSALRLIQKEFEDSSIKIEKDYGAEINIKGDAVELSQIFTNLLSNAKNAIIKSENRPGMINIKTYNENDKTIITITDNGCGIPEENKRRIFDPFFTSEDVGKGTGLGLSITQKMIEKYEGSIEFSSKSGEGTTFIVRFPKTAG